MKSNASAEVEDVGARVAEIQRQTAKLKARNTVLLTEADKNDEELLLLSKEHAELLRKFDNAAKLP